MLKTFNLHNNNAEKGLKRRIDSVQCVVGVRFHAITSVLARFSQFPYALLQMRYSMGENGCGHIFKEVPLAGR